MSSSGRPSYPTLRFRVRDISEQYGQPRFDLVFEDVDSGVERYSESVWETEAQAQIQASMLEEALARPAHWDVVGRTTGN